MVSDRQGHCERQLPPGKDDHPKGQGVDSRPRGGFVTNRRDPGTNAIQLIAIVLLCVSLNFCLSVPATAQAIYAENQIPARGVEIAYTVTIKNPASHLYDIEMSIKGIRDASVSVSMPAWSPGMYRIENYARNVQEFRAAN